jgi:LCP family protein required for cell wall assembly
MSNNYGPDDSTQPIGPASHEYPGQQGKLVLGGGSHGPNSEQVSRRPYQYPPSQQGQSGHAYPGQPASRSYNPLTPAAQLGQYGQQGVGPQAPYQPGQLVNGPGPASAKRPKGSRRRKGCAIGCLGMLVVLIVIGIFLGTTIPRLLDFGRAVSTKDPLSTETGYMGTSDRTNLLIMGYGGANHPGGTLTDSLVVTSMIPSTSHTSLVSVPRDLWVQNPPDSGVYSKINSVFSVASNLGQDRIAGGDATAKKVSQVTGLDVKYWMLIDFNGFEKLIDSIGGIDVYVPSTFTSDYPKNDDPNINADWIQVHFDKGNQHFDGVRAIQYARARHPIDNPAEEGDFARSARQQIIIKATLAKMQNVSNWPKLFDAMEALKSVIYTNMSLADLGLFVRKMDLNDPKTAHVSLSVSNVLAYATSDDGQSILSPQNNDWDAISKYVKSQLYT